MSICLLCDEGWSWCRGVGGCTYQERPDEDLAAADAVGDGTPDRGCEALGDPAGVGVSAF